jgi:hypothetical protein
MLNEQLDSFRHDRGTARRPSPSSSSTPSSRSGSTHSRRLKALMTTDLPALNKKIIASGVALMIRPRRPGAACPAGAARPGSTARF